MDNKSPWWQRRVSTRSTLAVLWIIAATGSATWRESWTGWTKSPNWAWTRSGSRRYSSPRCNQQWHEPPAGFVGRRLRRSGQILQLWTFCIW